MHPKLTYKYWKKKFYQDFLPALLTSQMIKATTGTTIKIPKPIPALNIPPTTAHPERLTIINSRRRSKRSVEFFIDKIY